MLLFIDTIILGDTTELAFLPRYNLSDYIKAGSVALLSFIHEGDESMKIESVAFVEWEMIPRKYTCDDMNVSPPLKWSSIPEGTKAFALICDDPDAPMGTWVHWVIFNMPAEIDANN